MSDESSITAYFGGDISGLKAAITEATAAVNSLAANTATKAKEMASGTDAAADSTRKLGDVAKETEKGMLNALTGRHLFTMFIHDAMEATANAQKLRTELEAQGRTVDVWTASLAKAGDSLAMLKTGFGNLAAAPLAGMTMLGESIGYGINRLAGRDNRQQVVADQAAQGADAQEKADQALRVKEYDPAQLKALRGELGAAQDHTAQVTGAAGQTRAESDVRSILADEVALSAKIASYKDDTVSKLKDEVKLEGDRAKLVEASQASQVRADTAKREQAEQEMTRTERLVAMQQKARDTEQQMFDARRKAAESGGSGDNALYEQKRADLAEQNLEIQKLTLETEKAQSLSLADQLKEFELLHDKSGALRSSLNDGASEQLKSLGQIADQKKLQEQINELLEKGVNNLNLSETSVLSTLIEQKRILDQKIDAQTTLNAKVDEENDKKKAAAKEEKITTTGAPLGMSQSYLDSLDTSTLSKLRTTMQALQTDFAANFYKQATPYDNSPSNDIGYAMRASQLSQIDATIQRRPDFGHPSFATASGGASAAQSPESKAILDMLGRINQNVSGKFSNT